MTTAVEPFQQPRPLRMSMGALEDPERLGRLLAASGYFEDTRDAAQAVVKVLAGAELGFGPIASMTGIYIVKGRVTLSANLMASAIKRHPKYDYRVVELSDQKAVVRFFENGEDVGTSEFTSEDARRANLTGENWRKYPRNMNFARSMSNGAKFYCPDVFAGAPVYTPDELGAEIDAETGELRRVDPPVGTEDRTGEVLAPPASVRETPTREPAATSTEPESSPPASPPAPNANDPINDAEVAKLTELLDSLDAPASFRRMALMTYGADDLTGLTVGQAHEVREKAVSRFGG